MFGASQKIHPGALPLMAGKTVTLIELHDPAGARATATWAEQLATVGATVTTWQVPEPGSDLNDHISAGHPLLPIVS
jgi:hypothetical protein